MKSMREINICNAAPNWRTEPYSVVTRLTSKKPNHPASSFFYEDTDQLRPIASFQFIKVSPTAGPLTPDSNFKLCAIFGEDR